MSRPSSRRLKSTILLSLLGLVLASPASAAQAPQVWTTTSDGASRLAAGTLVPGDAKATTVRITVQPAQTRQAIVGMLGRGPAPVSALAAPFAMALPSFMKHLSVLERSAVIRSSKTGRIRTCELQPRTLARAEAWIAVQRAAWEARSDRMTAFAERLHQQELEREPGPQRPRR